jgi:hypothetical protein
MTYHSSDYVPFTRTIGVLTPPHAEAPPFSRLRVWAKPPAPINSHALASLRRPKPTQSRRSGLSAVCALALLALLSAPNPQLAASPLGTAFTYQGRLASGGNAATGLYDFSFALYDAASNGNQAGSTLSTNAVAVTNGTFTVTLDFGNQYGGSALWLAVWVKTNNAGSYTALTPRQQLTPAPYASYTPYAGGAAVATLATSVAAGSITSAALAPGAVSQLGTPNGAQTNAVQVSTNGFVGIGTTNTPSAALEISSGTALLAPVVYAEIPDGTGSFTNLYKPQGVAFSGNLLAVAAYFDNAVTLADTSGDSLVFRASMVNGQGSFTNLAGATSVAFSTNNLLAVAANFSSGSAAVTLVDVSSPTAPVWKSVLRDNVGGFDQLGGANAVAFSTNNLLAIAAGNDNAVTLVTVANPAAPVKAGYMQYPYNSFTNIGSPIAVAFSGNLLAIAGGLSNAVTLADVSNPASPVLRSSIRQGQGGFNALSTPSALAFSGNLLAVAAYGANAVTLVNAANPASPSLYSVISNNSGGVCLLSGPKSVTLFQRSGRTLLSVCANGSDSVSVFDVTDPAKPLRRAAFVNGLAGVHFLRGPIASAVNGNGRLAIAANSSSAVTLLGLADRQAGLVSDTWVGIGTTNPLQAALDVNGDVVIENANLFQAQASRVELGQGAAASGQGATAIGALTTASGPSSTALGYYTTASGPNSTALGFDTTASGSYSTTLGYSTTASGKYSTSLGDQAIASGTDSTALGHFTTASGTDSTALGYSTTASGTDSTALGYHTTASGSYSMAAGHQAKALHQGAFVWADSQSADFSSTGNDQFLIRAQGGVGIGTATPTGALLDVLGNVRINDSDLYLRGNNGDTAHGLGWYSDSKLFANDSSLDGPVLYGCARGGLGTICNGQKLALRWQNDGNVVIDPGDANTGNLLPGLTFGNGSGEGIASRRNAGINQNGLDFYTGSTARMRIFNNGWVGIGRQPTANSLEVAGNASKDTAGSWLANSDARIKQDVAPLTNALGTLDRVRLVSFHYTEDYRRTHPGVEDRPYQNVIAQEFREVFPNEVKASGERLPDGSEILQVDTYPLTIYSAAAVQELNRKLTDELKRRDAENSELKQRVERLERLIEEKTGGAR